MDIARTQGKIIATNAANEKMKDVRPEDITAAKEQWEKANPGKVATAEDINNQIYQTAYNQAFNESGLGTGGSVQRAMQAATAAIQGLAGGNMAQALSGASAPYLAEVIKAGTGDNQVANAMAHAVLGAVTAYASGNNALAGAAGAATAELMAPIIIATMGWDKNNLSEDQKQTVSALATLAAGLAGGLIGDSTADTVAGAQTGKNAVENNALGKCSPLTCKALVDPLEGGGGIVGGGGVGKAKDKQIWSETKKKQPVPNAYDHWDKHKKEFPEYQNSKQYVDATHNFVNNPPSGTLIKTRPNGDTLYYNPTTNTFASKNIDGVPRTMFKPEKGMEYWNKQ
ncbi:adhesin/hemagglutinin [Yersinia frederiksenii]|nr:adhesin/hemagglutinin [Yersinia frederiksenii]